MKEATITNCIDIHGKEYRMEELSEEKRKQIAMLLSDRFIEMAGYRRTMYSVLTSSDEVSEEICRKVCDE